MKWVCRREAVIAVLDDHSSLTIFLTVSEQYNTYIEQHCIPLEICDCSDIFS
jgi:hypothetical protein